MELVYDNESIWQNSFDSFGIAWGEIHGNALANGLIKRSQILLYSTLIVVTLHIEKPLLFDIGKHKPVMVIYMYSLNKDVHRALELIHKTLERTLNELKNKVEWYENFIKTFEEKQEYIKNKYPSEEE